MKKLISLLLCVSLLLSAFAAAETTECDHANHYIISSIEGAEYEQIDEYVHLTTGMLTETMVCDDCNEEIVGEPMPYSEEEFHFFDENSVCENCGQVCTHAEVNSYEDLRDIKYEALDDSRHVVSAKQYEVTCCANCFYVFSEELTNADYRREEAHYFDEGRCVDCDMINPCTHETTERLDSLEYTDCQPKDEKEHIFTCILYHDIYCTSCGEYLGSELMDENYQETAPHAFSEGACYECGIANTCPHPETESSEVFSYLNSAQKNAFFHTLTGELYESVVCLDCGEEIAWNLLTDSHETESEHWLWDGECMECGYVDELPGEVRLVGEVLSYMRSLDSYALNIGAGITMLDVDKILSVDEIIAFKEIIPTEQWLYGQALAVMTAIGYGDAVQTALDYDAFAPSEQVSALLTAISERLAGLSAEEAAARDALLDEFFPVQRTTEEGRALRSFRLEVSNPENNGALTEVYALLYSEDFGGWIFDMVEAG